LFDVVEDGPEVLGGFAGVLPAEGLKIRGGDADVEGGVAGIEVHVSNEEAKGFVWGGVEFTQDAGGLDELDGVGVVEGFGCVGELKLTDEGIGPDFGLGVSDGGVVEAVEDELEGGGGGELGVGLASEAEARVPGEVGDGEGDVAIGLEEPRDDDQASGLGAELEHVFECGWGEKAKGGEFFDDFLECVGTEGGDGGLDFFGRGLGGGFGGRV